MKRIFMPMFVTASLLLFAGCRNNNDFIFKNYFWTSNRPEPMDLFINGRYRASLPSLYERPQCNNEELKKQALFIPLTSGSYELEAKDKKGNLKIAVKLKIYGNENNLSVNTSSHHHNGDIRVVHQGNCLIEELYY